MNKLQSYFIASVLYVMTPHAFAQGTVTIYLPGEQQTLSVGPVENVVQLVTQPQLRDRLWWPGALLTDSAAKAKALKDYQHVMAQLASWEAEADDDVAATIKSVRQQLLNLNITGAYRSNWTLILYEWMRTAIPRWSGTIRSIPYSVR